MRAQASRQASFGDLPWRIISTMVWPPEIFMFSSPFPVEPAAPTSLSTQHPAPMIGESPTRPGIFHDRPEVVVTAEDRKSTRLNSSHANISYAVFCLKKKKK